MPDYLIVVVNRVKARFFTFEPVDHPKYASTPKINETFALINPEAMLQTSQLFAHCKPDRYSTSLTQPVLSCRNSPEKNIEELRRRFAIKVSTRIRTMVKRNEFKMVIVASSARMHRFLCPHLDIVALKGPAVYKIIKNMINFSPTKIHNLLSELGLAPKQKRRLA